MNENENKEETVTIKKSTYAFLSECARKLRALEDMGVDNWKGYSQAMELLDDPEF